VTKATLTPSQQELLLGLPERIPVASIDRLWIFTAHLGKVRETGLFVLSLLPDTPEDRQRTLMTLSYQAEVVRNKLVRTESLAEEGRAPEEQIERVIAGVVARAHEESSELVTARIEGEAAKWMDLLGQLELQT
jgi:hypothetical protein